MGTFMQLGGRRLDNSASYHNQYYVAKAMNASSLSRDSLFITTKVGSYLPMGGAEALSQFSTFLRVTGLGKADLTLIHWPTCVTQGCESSTPSCQWTQPTYDEKECRLDTWRALVSLLNAGQTRAIGVSNYNETHIQEIIDAGLPLPSVNQCPFNLWHSKDAQPGQLLDFCKQHNILYNGYSPFGVPDRKTYPASFPKTMLEVSECASVPLYFYWEPRQLFYFLPHFSFPPLPFRTRPYFQLQQPTTGVQLRSHLHGRFSWEWW